MRNCRIYLKNKFDPIYIAGYVGHKIRKHGFSEFYSLTRVFQIWTKDIEYFSIDVEKGESDGKET